MPVRDRIRLTYAEIEAFLAAPLKMQLATIEPDGSPHLVTMYYAPWEGGRIAFWTYRTSQKARNLARDPRCTVLIETGEGYDQLRGVSLNGTVEAIDEVAQVLAIGTRVYGRYLAHDGDTSLEALTPYLEDQARKRRAFLLTPSRVASWDHRKIAAAYAVERG